MKGDYSNMKKKILLSLAALAILSVGVKLAFSEVAATRAIRTVTLCETNVTATTSNLFIVATVTNGTTYLITNVINYLVTTNSTAIGVSNDSTRAFIVLNNGPSYVGISAVNPIPTGSLFTNCINVLAPGGSVTYSSPNCPNQLFAIATNAVANTTNSVVTEQWLQ